MGVVDVIPHDGVLLLTMKQLLLFGDLGKPWNPRMLVLRSEANRITGGGNKDSTGYQVGS